MSHGDKLPDPGPSYYQSTFLGLKKCSDWISWAAKCVSKCVKDGDTEFDISDKQNYSDRSGNMTVDVGEAQVIHLKSLKENCAIFLGSVYYFCCLAVFSTGETMKRCLCQAQEKFSLVTPSTTPDFSLGSWTHTQTHSGEQGCGHLTHS